MILYSKFNNYRKAKFQLITNIEDNGTDMFSSKTSSSPESLSFLNSIYYKYEYLQKNQFSFKPVKPEKIKKDKLLFKYQNLKSLDFILLKSLTENNKDNFIKIFKEYISTIKNNKIYDRYLSDDFNKVFNPKSKEKVRDELLTVGCIDLNFNNIFIDNKKNNYILIDYEWSFEFPIPFKYIIFRAITDFYSRYHLYRPNDLIKLNSLYKIANISTKEEKMYIDYEYNFQIYVLKDEFKINTNQKNFYTNYQKLKLNIELKRYFTELRMYQSENQNLSKQIEEVSQIVLKYQSENQNLFKKINNLVQEKGVFQKENKRLKSDLNKIQSSKTYKVWQDFNKIKKYIIKKRK